MKKLSVSIALALLASAAPVHAAPPVTAKVTYVGTYGDGRTFVGIDTTINEPGCALARFDFPSSHPLAKTWLAIAMAASASGKNVVVQTSGCFGGSLPTMTQGTDSYFYLQS